MESKPKAIVLINNNNDTYAIPFGYSYHNVNKYADKNWPFEFAKRVDYNNIKSLEINLPNSKMFKKINSYRDYNILDIDSGESLMNIDGNLSIDSSLENILNEHITIRNSVKLIIKEYSLKSIAYAICYINNVIVNEENVKTSIPRFRQIRDKQRCSDLDKYLNDMILNLDDTNLDFDYSYENQPLSNFNDFTYSFLGSEKTVHSLEIKELMNFIKECNVNEDDCILKNLNVGISNTNERFNLNLKDLLFFECNDENQKFVLMDGNWYYYNWDYLNYLKQSMDDLGFDDSDLYPFYNENFFNYIKNNDDKIIYGYEEFDKHFDYIKLYFNEEHFNESLRNEGYGLLDRKLKSDDGHKVEIGDLYKDGVIYAVKMGKSSAKLAYVVDQSLEGLNYIHKDDTLEDDTLTSIKKNLETVCIWLILDKVNKIDSLNDLNMLILKNKLDYWKKEVRLKGYKPLVKISYKFKPK